MFKKILVANRGEIAVRVIRTCAEMGVSTVAVFSDADRGALHVQYADEAYRIGPPPAAESYLAGERLIALAKRVGAEAIHPGYGFLAENADFAQACADAGVAFIGPSASAMRLSGDKLQARATMVKAGVPVIPGLDTAEIADDELPGRVEEIGYPVMVKAAGGGGGKGIRTVQVPDELEASIRQARAEAASSFGDDRVYIEKMVVNPRHIEVQILGDAHGNTLHLFERECSIQRRHQKLVEESPSPALTDSQRAAMTAAAVKAARAVNYDNAGTIEFLRSNDGSFYFLEVNARLQVEHPVTEMLVGRDLVRAQLRVAAGEKLWFDQEEVVSRGSAIECRICAEDPDSNFYPATGTVSRMRAPGGPGVRLDAGCFQGYQVPVYYDPLIGKLIVWGEDRPGALDRLERALNEFILEGFPTTLPFFRWLVKNDSFRSGDFDTGFIARHYRPGPIGESELERAASVLCALLEHEAVRGVAEQRPDGDREASPWKYLWLKNRLGSY
ncbi:MAG TPA: acetyl-CoA carboxylase biotin carboxylase subunit [Candidatus Coatesbacteria bacterium]|nr:acetyl-CoA carboxylase biotin carboxylase subunit [Candidatus Coatesbacteria bacterium]